MKHISIGAFRQVLDAEKHNHSVDFVNVCTSAEYKERHIPGVRNVPLLDIEKHAAEFRDKETIYVHCRSGNRSKQAIEKLEDLGIKAELVNVEGGILAWGEAGFPTHSLTKRIPLSQQVLIVAGALVLFGVVASLGVHPYFIGLSGFVGAGLLFAGITGWCGMAHVLARMPWNR